MVSQIGMCTTNILFTIMQELQTFADPRTLNDGRQRSSTTDAENAKITGFLPECFPLLKL